MPRNTTHSPVSHWDTINGSPNRKWRYMTDYYNPAYHWWQHANPFIVIPASTPNHYQYITFARNTYQLVRSTTYRTLRECQRAALAAARATT